MGPSVRAVALMALGVLGPALSWAQLTPQQAIAVHEVPAIAITSDGHRVAFRVQGPPRGRSIARDVWVWNGSGSAAAYSSNGASFGAQWSPDGRQIAYLSDSDGGPQIYVGSGKDRSIALTRHGSGVSAFRWSPDGKQIAFLATDPSSTSEQDARRDPRVIHVVSGSDLPRHLWVIDLSSGTERQITTGTLDVSEVSWKPDGSGFVVLASAELDPEHAMERIYSVDAAGGTYLQLLDPKTVIEQVELSPDGRSITYLGPHGDGITPSDLYILPSRGGTPRDLTASLDRQVDAYRWRDNSTLVASIAFGFEDRLYTVATAGKATAVRGFASSPQTFDDSRSGVIALVRNSAAEPPEVWVSRENGDAAHAITQLNRGWDAIARARGEIVRYTSFDGTPIEGELLRPSGSANSAKLPTIFWMHGGPIGRWEDRFDPEGQFLASHGYAVFYPNIRGSRGYGQQLIDLIRSKARGGTGWADGTLKDILAGADALVERGIAAPDHLGIGGWSAGGYFTALAVTRSNRFKAGVAGSGFYDMLNDLGTEISSFVAGDRWSYGNFFDPTTQRELHEDSPIATVYQAHTPILLLHGELDRTDTIGQVYEFYRGLQSYGAPSRLVVYHDTHGFQEEAHIVDQMNRTLAWFDNYVRDLHNDVSVSGVH